jgi:hypothetical protein
MKSVIAFAIVALGCLVFASDAADAQMNGCAAQVPPICMGPQRPACSCDSSGWPCRWVCVQ